MSTLDLLLLAIALSMDAFAVSICKGLASKGSYIKTGLVCGLWFGVFQALMPFLGWLLGSTVASYVEKYSAYLAFILLTFLGIKMIYEPLRELKEERKLREEMAGSGVENYCLSCSDNEEDASLSPKIMLVFAIATSIDALAAGLSFAATGANVWIAISFIGVTTFLFSFVGSAVGAKIGGKFKHKAEIAGGVILIGIGIKILVEHLLSLF